MVLKKISISQIVAQSLCSFKDEPTKGMVVWFPSNHLFVPIFVWMCPPTWIFTNNLLQLPPIYAQKTNNHRHTVRSISLCCHKNRPLDFKKHAISTVEHETYIHISIIVIIPESTGYSHSGCMLDDKPVKR